MTAEVPEPPPPVPSTGTLEVSVSTTGADVDVDGFGVAVGAFPPRGIELNGSLAVDLRSGTHSVGLEDLAGNCSVSGAHPVGVTISSGETARVEFAITCAPIAPLLDRIVYGCDSSIRAIDVGGGTEEAITADLRPDGAVESEPAISPDGKRVAFGRKTDDVVQLVVANVDGGDDWVVGEGQVLQGLSWSPDGTRILFHTLPPVSGILVVDWDGKGSPAPLPMDVRSGDSNPQWSPDGTKIAFISDRTGGVWGDLFVMNADGSGITQLTSTGTEFFQPYWSPDGSRIAFSSLRHATGNALEFAIDEAELYLIDPDASNLTRVTDDLKAHDRGGAWSPDGTRLAMVSNRGQTGAGTQEHIYTMDPDGGNVVRVTSTPCTPGSDPVWSPSG